MDVFDNSTLRETNESRQMLNVRQYLVSTIKNLKTSYLGHLMRHKEYELLQVILMRKILVEGKRRIGKERDLGFAT